jgi:L-2-hydroxyglutarate oxidase
MYDFCVIGGGIVGLATALSLQDAFPGCGLVVVEKEADVGRHQTGHNSGVIHAGIYYAPGSLKARLCREGAAATKAFCAEHGIPFETCGKLLVATTPLEVGRMGALQERAGANGIECERLDGAELLAREPNSPASRPVRAVDWIIDYKRCAPSAGWWWSEAESNCGSTSRRDRCWVEVIRRGRGQPTRRWRAPGSIRPDRPAGQHQLTSRSCLPGRVLPLAGEGDVVRSLITPSRPRLPFLNIHSPA